MEAGDRFYFFILFNIRLFFVTVRGFPRLLLEEHCICLYRHEKIEKINPKHSVKPRPLDNSLIGLKKMMEKSTGLLQTERTF